MSKVFNLAFQTSTNFSDSPGAIVSDSVVYAYATQGSKTFLVFENGTSRLANNTLGSVKVGLGLVSIGVPTRVNGNAWNNGEVVDKGYAEFVCLITQSIGDPTITTIKNEISESVNATYVSTGIYNLVFGSISTTLAGGGIFPANNGSLNITLQNGNYTNPIGTALWFEAYRSDDARIAIESYDGVDLVDNVLANAMLQVRLYY